MGKKRILIDLDEEVADVLTGMGDAHGHKLKPFIEWLLGMQSGVIPLPDAGPIDIDKIDSGPVVSDLSREDVVSAKHSDKKTVKKKPVIKDDSGKKEKVKELEKVIDDAVKKSNDSWEGKLKRRSGKVVSYVDRQFGMFSPVEGYEGVFYNGRCYKYQLPGVATKYSYELE